MFYRSTNKYRQRLELGNEEIDRYRVRQGMEKGVEVSVWHCGRNSVVEAAVNETG